MAIFSTAFSMLQLLALVNGAIPLDHHNKAPYTLQVRLNYHKWIDVAKCNSLTECNKIGQAVMHQATEKYSREFSPLVRHIFWLGPDCDTKIHSGWVICYHVREG